MKIFVKIFVGYADEVENEINETIRKRNLKIISISTCSARQGLYATVVFEKIA